MVRITVDVSEAKGFLGRGREEGARLLFSLEDFARRWFREGLEGLLKSELTLLLEKEQEAGEENSRNGFRQRTLVLAGLGPVKFFIPRDRRSRYQSQFLPFRKRRTQGLDALAAEMFLAGLSTRDVSRVLERHFGEKMDSKEVSRVVEGTSSELDAWRERRLTEKYRFLYLDGANFKVRRNKQVEKIPFLAVIGVRAGDDKMEVLAIEVGDKEKKALWEELFRGLLRRGLDEKAVELGIMDGLPGLEEAFRAAFPNARTQRCQVHAARNAIKRVAKKDREAFKKDLHLVFYAKGEAKARKAFVQLKSKWGRPFPSAVQTIEKDLDSLLRFYQWEEKYWPSLRTTNPIERLNKEFKRRTKAMEVTGGENTTYRLLAYVALTMNMGWKKYSLSTPKHFYTLKAD